MTEVHRNGVLDLSLRFEELAPSIGLNSCNKLQCVRDSQIGDLSLGLASIQDPKGPLRTKEDDLIADSILEKASDWTCSKNILFALLQRLILENVLPYSNQVVMSAMATAKAAQNSPSDDKWMAFLAKNKLTSIDLLFRQLVFWSRNMWKRSKLSEDNCALIRRVICAMVKGDASAKGLVLKICSQNLVIIALNQGSNVGFDQATFSLTEDIVTALLMEPPQETGSADKKDKPVCRDLNEVKLYDALACVVLSTKTSKQPWALEILVKILRHVVNKKASVFKTISHFDGQSVLPEMAQLQWNLSDYCIVSMKPSPNGQFLALMTFSGAIFIVNQDGYASSLKISNPNKIKDLVWVSSCEIQDLEDDRLTHDLIGFSDKIIYIWDPVHCGEPLEMAYEFGPSTKLTAVDGASMVPNSLFVLGTSNGLVFSPNSQSTPFQAFSGNDDIKLTGSPFDEACLFSR